MQYSDCLNSAAHRNRNFSCAGCERYEKPDPVLSGIEQELKGKLEMPRETINKGKLCSVEGCHKPAAQGGMCWKHKRRSEKGQPMHGVLKHTKTHHPGGKCDVEGCQKSAYVKGKCKTHYKNALRGKVIEVAKQEETIAPGSQVIHKLIEKASAHVNGRAETLANEHWSYVRDLLEVHGQEELYKIEFHYKSAMIHGYKHGVADRERTASS